MQRYAQLLIVLPVFLLDRWTKLLVVDRLAEGDVHNVASWLAIVHWHNKGGLFGFMSRHGAGYLLFLILPLAIIAALLYYLAAYRPPLWSRLSLIFVLAGALGNIYDRIAYGYVVDFVLVHYGELQWPAFNVADSSITFGIGLWLFAQIFLKEGAGKPAKGGST
jgi:signal peptidase II